MMIGKIKTAVVLPQSLVNAFLEKGKKYPHVDMTFYKYEKEEDIIKNLEAIADDTEAVLYAGLLSYERGKELPQLKEKLQFYIPYDAFGLLKILYELAQKNIDLENVSFDTADTSIFQDIFRDADFVQKHPSHVLEFDPKDSLSNMIKFHEKLYREGKTKFAVTSASCCMNELLKKGIPCKTIFPIGAAISRAIEQVERAYENRSSQGNRIAIINIENQFLAGQYGEDMKRTIRKRLEMHVKHNARLLCGNYINIGADKCIILTNRRYADEATAHFTTTLPLMEEISSIEGIRVDIGIGFGAAANLAMENSLYALKQAKKNQKGACMVLSEESELIGPLGKCNMERLFFRYRDDEITRLAQMTCSSVTTMGRIMEGVHCLGNEFTVGDLQAFVHINKKSLERIVRQLHFKGVVSVVGQEARQDKGKPRRIYRFISEQEERL